MVCSLLPVTRGGAGACERCERIFIPFTTIIYAPKWRIERKQHTTKKKTNTNSTGATEAK